ncbi:MAG: hypothetical protein ACR2M1_16740, partial [Gemmatimonadaceae bacterium]
MRALNLRSLLVAVVVFSAPALVAAQRPSSQQAQQMLRNNPALIEQLRQRIATSGLTPDQVRARLRAEGYPENLLDPYLEGGNQGQGQGQTGGSGQPSSDVFAAVRELGVADTADLDSLRCGTGSDTLSSSADLFGLFGGSTGTARPLAAGSSASDTLRYNQVRRRTADECAIQ